MAVAAARSRRYAADRQQSQAPPALSESNSLNSPDSPAVGTVCVARQPIFDAQLNVIAYEMLYRDQPDDDHARVVDGAAAAATA
jgi:hypothetical protein